MSWVLADLNVKQLKSEDIDLQHELMGSSSDENYYHAVQSAELAKITEHYTNENDLIDEQYDAQLEGLEAGTEEYLKVRQEKLEKQKEVSNEQAAVTQSHQDKVARKENEYKMRQEVMETRIKVVQSEIETWKEYRASAIEKECAYFND